MNPKKLLQILEIVCPIFTHAEDDKGNVNTNSPLGYAIWFFARIAGVIKEIWKENNECVETAAKLVMLLIRIAFSIALLPIVLLLWIIGNLIFSIRYDKKHKSHLFVYYSFVTALLIALCVMVADYKSEGKIQEMITTNISQSIDDIKPEVTTTVIKREPTRSIAVNAEEKPVQEEVILVTEITEASTEVSTEIIVNEDEGYSIQRKSRSG